MRILFVVPYPPSRIRVRSYGFLTQLRKKHELTIAMLCRSEQELADAEELRSQGYDVLIVYESKWQARLRSGAALVGSSSMHVAYARSGCFSRALQSICTKKSFDIIHVEHLRGLVPMECLVSTYPLIWDAVDCISQLYKHTIVSGPNFSTRTMALLEHGRIQQYEAKMLDKLEHVVVTSNRDRQAMIDLKSIHTRNLMSDNSYSNSSITVLPNGVDLEYFRPVQRERKRFNIVFSGKMNYHPNVATVLYLYQQIMPLVWLSRPEVTLTVVGSEPTRAIQRLADDPRVEVTGRVDDIRPYIGRAEVMVCPLVYSTGIQNKVLEAMALGTPVVTTPQVAEALSACPGRDLLVAESQKGLTEATLSLLDDADLSSILSRHGRVYVEEHHDWQKLTNELLDVYQNAIATHARKDSLLAR